MTAKDPYVEIITREDWNVVSEEAVKNLDDPMLGFHIYVGSKMTAERAAWAFMEEKKVSSAIRLRYDLREKKMFTVLQPAFSMTTVLGSFLFGPVFKALTEPPRMDHTLGGFHATFANPPRVDGISPVPSSKHPWHHRRYSPNHISHPSGVVSC